MRVLYAYTGTPAGTAAIRALAASGEVVTLTIDVGQGGELLGIRERALGAGAARAHVLDLRETFASDFLLPALQAGASQPDPAAVGVALGTQVLARAMADVARMEGAAAVAHGAGASRARLDRAFAALEPSLDIIALDADPRDVQQATLWGRSGDRPALTRDPAACAGDRAIVTIEFDAGTPARANGVDMSLVELCDSLDTIAGAHGVGRIAAAAPRMSEAPAAVVLQTAYDALAHDVLPRSLDRIRADVAAFYRELIMSGDWFTEGRSAADAFVRELRPAVSGAVRLKLASGECTALDVAPRATAGAAREDR